MQIMNGILMMSVISGHGELHKFYQRSCIIIVTDLSNTIQKMLDKISFQKHFKVDLQNKYNVCLEKP